MRHFSGEVHAARFERQLVYFFTMGQVWDFLDVAVDKPRWALAACVAMIEKLKPVKLDSSECLRKRYEELRTIGEQAKMEGVYSYLLTKAVAEKILGGLPPTEKEPVRAKSSKPATGPPVDSLQTPETCGGGNRLSRRRRAQGRPRRPPQSRREPRSASWKGARGPPTNWWSARSFSVWAPSTGTCTA